MTLLDQTVSRRDCLRVGASIGGALLIGIPLDSAAATASSTGQEPAVLGGWVRIDRDGNVTLLTNATEMGQGAQTGLAQVLADELELDWQRVRIEMAPIERAYYGMWETYQTGGSGSVRGMFARLRTAGATARALLIQAAAQRWGVPADACAIADGQVVHPGSRRKIAWGELIEVAATLPVPAVVELKPREQWRYIGKPVKRLDIASKVDGSAIYGIDVRFPGLLVATIAHCPVFGGRLDQVDPAPAMSVKGVHRVVRLDAAVAVVARDYWTARRGLAALRPKWSASPMSAVSSDTIRTRLRALLDEPGTAFAGQNEDAAQLRERCMAALAASRRRIEREYEVPLVSHSPLEPMNGTAHVTERGAELWVPTQVQSDMRTDVAKALGIDEAAVTIHTTQLGGGFGRRLKTDYGVEAALIAREARAPVKLVWSREEDTQHGFYRPCALARITAGVDEKGALTAVHAHVACIDADQPVGGLVGQPYALPNLLVSYAGFNPGVPLGAWRAVDPTFNTFFLESFIDELAGELGRDPFEYRRELLASDPRALRVFDAAVAAGANPPPGRHRGAALLRGFGSLMAEVAEVSVQPDGRLTVHRVACAIDCGTAVNPDQIRAQTEGGVVFALSAALHGSITIKGGAVEQANFDSYPLVRMADAPQVSTSVLESPDAPVGGVGEPPVPPMAPALVNAIFSATGRRIRTLPIAAQELKPLAPA